MDTTELENTLTSTKTWLELMEVIGQVSTFNETGRALLAHTLPFVHDAFVKATIKEHCVVPGSGPITNKYLSQQKTSVRHY